MELGNGEARALTTGLARYFALHFCGFGRFANDRMAGRAAGMEARRTSRGFTTEFGSRRWGEDLRINRRQTTTGLREGGRTGALIPRTPAGRDQGAGHNEQSPGQPDDISPGLEAFGGTQSGRCPAQVLLEKPMAMFLTKATTIRWHDLAQRERDGAAPQKPTDAGVALGPGRTLAGDAVDGELQVARGFEVQLMPSNHFDLATVGHPARIRFLLGGGILGAQWRPIPSRVAAFAGRRRSLMVGHEVLAHP